MKKPMNAKSSFIVASAIAVVLTSTRLLAQSDASTGEYGYKFVPTVPNSQWGGEIWFTVPSEANGPFGYNYETDFAGSYIITPYGPFDLEVPLGGNGPVTPNLPQSPFPYTGAINLSVYSTFFDWDLAPPFATWNASAITALSIGIDSEEKWNGSYNGGQFETPGVYGVFEQNGIVLTQDSISIANSFQPLTQGELDPSDGGTVMGQWVPIPDRTNTLPLLGLTALALFGASRRLRFH
jgi:hypothetical protein